MSKIYLSIDIDYWSVPGCNRGQMISYLRKSISSTDNVKAFLMHHEMLGHVNSSGADTLYNVDYHSDLADIVKGVKKDKDFNEGTWVNYVKFSENGFFRWYYPEWDCFMEDGMGRCEGEYDPFVKDSYSVCGWAETSHRYRRIPDPRSMNIVGVGICISPDWIPRSLGFRALEFLHKEKIITEKFYYNALNHVVARGKYDDERDYVDSFDEMSCKERESFVASLFCN